MTRRCSRGSSAAAPKAPAAPRSPAPQPPRRPFFGFNDNAIRAGLLTADQDAELTSRVGADLHRLTFDWRWVEPQPGQLRLADYDRIYKAMRARGIRPLLVLMFAPHWAWDANVTCNQWARDCRYPPAREHYAAWRRIAALLATRYPEAAGIEVWNEPNTTNFWRPFPDVARYTELLKEAHRAIKAANPGMRVITGGFADEDVNATGGDISLPDFVRGVYQNGGKPYMDAIGFHPYPTRVDLFPGGTVDRAFARVRGVRDAFGDRAKPLWVTEAGLSTTGLDRRLLVTEAQQASGLAAHYRAMAQMPDVQAVVFHTLLSPALPDTDIRAGYGVVRSDLTPKPAYCALAIERGSTFRCR